VPTHPLPIPSRFIFSGHFISSGSHDVKDTAGRTSPDVDSSRTSVDRAHNMNKSNPSEVVGLWLLRYHRSVAKDGVEPWK